MTQEQEYAEKFNWGYNKWLDRVYPDITPINESSINRVMKHGEYGFIIISSQRSSITLENRPDDDYSNLLSEYEKWKQIHKDGNEEKFLIERNREAERDLWNDIKQKGYTYSSVYGGYHYKDSNYDTFEKSYIIYNFKRGQNKPGNFEELKEFGLELCRKYKQESVYIQPPKGDPMYFDGNGNVVDEFSSGFKFNRPEEEYFTTIKRKKKRNGHRFTAISKDGEIRECQVYVNMTYSSINGLRIRKDSGEITFVEDRFYK